MQAVDSNGIILLDLHMALGNIAQACAVAEARAQQEQAAGNYKVRARERLTDGDEAAGLLPAWSCGTAGVAGGAACNQPGDPLHSALPLHSLFLFNAPTSSEFRGAT